MFALRFVVLVTAVGAAGLAAAQTDPQGAARRHYDEGAKLFSQGDRDQALMHFQRAHELSPNPTTLFMIAQSEYHLGKIQDALHHYEEFLRQQPTGDSAETARIRLEVIKRRRSTVFITTFPTGADVRIEGERETITGQAPNPFEVWPGTHRITVSKPNYVTETQQLPLELGEDTQLVFQLKPIPARLEIRTTPRNAALYVRGNRAQNPYAQQVDPGTYEIYAEAADHGPSRMELVLRAGEQRSIDLQLAYVQRSGRPELIGFWTAAGAIGGGSAVRARVNTSNGDSRAATLITLGTLAGGLGAGVIATALVPDYLRDNLALFRIGAMWVGAAEGAGLALTLHPRDMSAAWVGGAAGLGAGALLGTWLDDRAPNYGRVALIQSGALMGALAGSLAVPAFDFDADKHAAPTVLVGMNIGLGAGLALAYLPDQRQYGPSWQRVLLVNLAGVAGGVAGSLLERCVGEECRVEEPTARTARFALAGGAVGLAAGWLLTRNYDRNRALERRPPQMVPSPALIPIQTTDGKMSFAPGVAARGGF